MNVNEGRNTNTLYRTKYNELKLPQILLKAGLSSLVS